MPIKFNQEEKIIIHNRLLEEGKKSWEKYGIKKTSVEEICKGAGISKGSFYLFFESKELFFMEILEKTEAEIKTSLIETIKNRKGSTKEKFESALFEIYNGVKNYPWLINLMSNEGDYEYLIRKLPNERIEKNIIGDDEDVKKILMVLGIDYTKLDIKSISAALRGLFLILLHEQEIGKKNMDKAFTLLLKGLVEVVFKEELLWLVLTT